MDYDSVLISSSEIALKSEPVRRMLEKKLAHNLRFRLIRSGISDHKIIRKRGRIVVEGTDMEKAATEATKVFGVFSSMPAVKTPSDFAMVIKKMAEYSSHVINDNETFAVEAKRSGDLPYVSKDLEFSGGAAILNRLAGRGVRVNLTEPDTVIHVEAREEWAYVYSTVMYGPGGLPIGFQGRAIGMISGRSLSLAASWMMMKRGAMVLPVSFSLPPKREDEGEAVQAISLLREYVPLKLFPYYSITLAYPYEEISAKHGEEIAYILKKRTMTKISSMIAEKEHAEGLISGEMFDYSEFFTLRNLRLIDQASSLPVYRPLTSLGQEDLRELTKKIEGYEPPVKVPTEKSWDPSALLEEEMIKRLERKLRLDSVIEEATRKLERKTLT
ncbi:MAG TPA: THUMP domain-containing protein [Candidatus Bathyarchaeia archaeon]|nr:MAG: hypothetical protein A3K70_01960 [Candidatus Bathyarchaeota archaeon RBG_16_48_13]HJX23483.1 THUMP domain-containing protein [Candidatus Bathyarchaeia archaeon]